MGNWDRLFNACKDATGVEIEDTFDASEVVDQLDSKVRDLTRTITKMYSEEEVKLLCSKAIWDYINTDMRKTDYDGGVSCDKKSHTECNIDTWFEQFKK